ncbi:unnamed protein product [Protopolystoma xenopodis]|uniref:Uncharacterized protein n=1 Tax=Protopolystoma xenopodis TaxID=117903 RepID=A0A3S5BMS0_9PLAT|nr:unnamed protein product [Protopolystoma xenopodis]
MGKHYSSAPISTVSSTSNIDKEGGKYLGGLRPGESVVFACLEVVICALARYQPAVLEVASSTTVPTSSTASGIIIKSLHISCLYQF